MSERARCGDDGADFGDDDGACVRVCMCVYIRVSTYVCVCDEVTVMLVMVDDERGIVCSVQLQVWQAYLPRDRRFLQL